MRRGRDEVVVSFFSFQDVMVCTIGLTILMTLLLVLQVGATASARTAAVEATEPADDAGLAAVEAELAALRGRLVDAERRAAVDPNAALAPMRRRLLDADAELRRLRGAILDAEARLAAALRGAELDADAAVADELRRRRERLVEELAAAERRRRIVYLLDRAEPFPPTVAEVSGSRIVLSFDQEAEAAQKLDVADPDAAAAALLDLFASREDWRKRTLLVVLKPSGLAVHRALLRLLAEDPRGGEVVLGLDLMPEDQWTSDAFPAPRSAEAPSDEVDGDEVPDAPAEPRP